MEMSTIGKGSGARVAFLMSRQARTLSARTWWLRAAHAAAQWAVRQGWVLVSGSGQIPIDFVRWSYRYHGGSIVEAPVSGDRISRRERMRERDRLVIASADVLVGVSIRRGGIMEEEGTNAVRSGKPVHVLAPPSNTSAYSGNSTLLKLGAARLDISGIDPGAVEEEDRRQTRSAQKEIRLACITPNSDVATDPPSGFLWHFTRACPGPWPGQSLDEYFLSLAQQDPGSSHTGLAALVRILAERRIRASGKIIRGKFEVVSFSATPPEELLARRRFRSTLARWDFEPYAIGVRQSAAEALGIRPVAYLSAAQFGRLPGTEQPFFQRADAGSLDWRHENEWRHPGDVDLSRISDPDLAALVPAECAGRIRPLLTR